MHDLCLLQPANLFDAISNIFMKAPVMYYSTILGGAALKGAASVLGGWASAAFMMGMPMNSREHACGVLQLFWLFTNAIIAAGAPGYYHCQLPTVPPPPACKPCGTASKPPAPCMLSEVQLLHVTRCSTARACREGGCCTPML